MRSSCWTDSMRRGEADDAGGAEFLAPQPVIEHGHRGDAVKGRALAAAGGEPQDVRVIKLVLSWLPAGSRAARAARCTTMNTIWNKRHWRTLGGPVGV